MPSRIVSPVSTCPVSLDILRQHAVLDRTDDEQLLAHFGSVATGLVEGYMGRYCISRPVTWSAWSDDPTSTYPLSVFMLQRGLFSKWLHLPHAASSITSVAYGVWGDDDVELVEGEDYQIDLASDPARIRLLSGSPLYGQGASRVSVTYVTGYGDTADAVPVEVKQAIMVLVTRMRENRGDEGADVWSPAVDSLLGPHRILRFGAAPDLYSA